MPSHSTSDAASVGAYCSPANWWQQVWQWPGQSPHEPSSETAHLPLSKSAGRCTHGASPSALAPVTRSIAVCERGSRSNRDWVTINWPPGGPCTGGADILGTGEDPVVKVISGGQTGVDRAALDVAIGSGIEWGGWCPRGGWAEDLTQPPGLLAKYPHLRETPHPGPSQRTEWNLRDSDAALFIVDGQGLAVSVGTQHAHEWARKQRKPTLVVRTDDPGADVEAAEWLRVQLADFGADLALSIAGPRESEAPGIYKDAKEMIAKLLSRLSSARSTRA
jgi:Circularly permutated YpsA SLOG family